LYGSRRIEAEPLPPRPPRANTVTSSTNATGRFWRKPASWNRAESRDVWAVDLAKGIEPDEIKGTLELSDAALCSRRSTSPGPRCGSR
jgi:hypothetical protein